MVVFDNSNTQTKVAYFIEIWKKVFIDKTESPDEVIKRYFTTDYRFYINGIVLSYTDMLNRAKLMRSDIKSAEITIIDALSELNKLATIHQVDALTQEDKHVRIYLHNFLEFEAEKIKIVRSLTQNLIGDKKNADIASRH